MNFKKLIPAVWIVLASLLFATDSTVRYQGVGHLNVSVVGMLEHAIALFAVIPLLVFYRKKGVLAHSSKDWFLFLILGVGGSALAGTIFGFSIQYLGPSLASLFTMFQPLFVLFFAYYFLGERYSSFFIPCALWVVANSILISLSGNDLDQTFDDPLFFKGTLFALLATAIWGGSTVIGKALCARYASSTIVFWRFIFALTFLIAVVWVQAPVESWSPYFETQQIRLILFLGTVSQAAAYFFYYLGLRKMQASMATFIELLYPLAGVLIATKATGHGFGFLQTFGAVNLLIALGLLLSIEYPKAVRTDP